MRVLNTPATGADILSATFDDIPHQLVVVDHEGTIVLVNDAYVAFARDNGYQPLDGLLGANYLKVCQQAAAEGHRDSAIIAEALSDILHGNRQNFETVYDCHSPYEQRWFRLTIARWEHGGQHGATMVHENATPAVEADRAILRALHGGRVGETQYAVAVRERMDALAHRISYVTEYDIRATGPPNIRAVTAPEALMTALAQVLLAGAQDGIRIDVEPAGRSVLLSLTGLAAAPIEALEALAIVPGRCDFGVQHDGPDMRLDIMLRAARRERSQPDE